VVVRERQERVVGAVSGVHAIDEKPARVEDVDPVLVSMPHGEVLDDDAVRAISSDHDVLAERAIDDDVARRLSHAAQCDVLLPDDRDEVLCVRVLHMELVGVGAVLVVGRQVLRRQARLLVIRTRPDADESPVDRIVDRGLDVLVGAFPRLAHVECLRRGSLLVRHRPNARRGLHLAFLVGESSLPRKQHEDGGESDQRSAHQKGPFVQSQVRLRCAGA
jgi:hypothetical protein